MDEVKRHHQHLDAKDLTVPVCINSGVLEPALTSTRQNLLMRGP